MNKYVTIVIVLIILVGAGVGYRTFIVSDADKPQSSGKVREVTIVAKKDSWSWEPNVIEAEQGETIKLTLINEDTYDHGFSIDAFGVNQKIPKLQTITTEFTVTQPGEFPFYCSVACGSGIVDGVERGHFDQTGRLKVKAVINTTPEAVR